MNIIVTGASRGIGFDTALALAANPEHKVLALARSTVKLEALKQQAIEKGYQNLNYLAYDLTHPDTEQLVMQLKAMGPVSIIINNAGMLINKPFLELTKEDWQSVFNVNVFGVVELIKTLLPWMEGAERPHILNISSMGGFQGSSKFPGLSAYSSSKAALANLSECLAEELKDKGIKVNCLAIGAVQTEMLEEAFPGYQAPVKSEEMASFFAYFATEGQRFYNGKVLPVALSTP